MSERDDLIEAIQRIAEQLQSNAVPRHEFLRQTGYSERLIQRHFGTYNALVEAAGLEPRVFPATDGPIYTDEELIAECIRVFRMPHSKLTRVYFDQNARMSSSVCERRFGGWINTVRTAANALDSESDRALLEKVFQYTDSVNQPVPRRNASPKTSRTPAKVEPEILAPVAYDSVRSDSANVYGDFINFRGLQHAPVNEQGVVFLFGMISGELGYVVEIVKSGFPDCEAKRRLHGRDGMWQRVRIEFEFRSRNFRLHGHDPDQCDVIVCWEDNWPECPIEVLELRSAVTRLA